jgi:signal transduction histidine kinase
MSTNASQPTPFHRLSAHKLAWWLAGPIAAIVVASALTAAWIVHHSAKRIDEVQAANDARLAHTAFSAVTESTHSAANDYARWDEIYDQFEGTVDLEWATNNLGPNFESSFKATYTFVIQADGALRYASIPIDGKQVQLTQSNAPELAQYRLDDLKRAATRLVKTAQNDPDSFLEGFILFQGVPAFVAIRPILPLSAKRVETDKPKNALIVIKAFDAQLVASISKSYGLNKLTVGAAYTIALPQLAGADANLGARWTPARQGAQFSSEAATILVPVGAAALILMALTAIGWWRAVGSIRAAELQALEERARSVQDTARAKSLFVANMSHELRTPLNAIIGFSEVIKEQMLGPLHQPKYVEYANDVHSSGQHLLGIVNNILTLSKIEAQQQRIHIENVSVTGAVSDALRMITPDATKRRVRIETAFDGAPVARADVQALVQITINLLSNAVKFSPAGSTVSLKVFGRDGAIVLTVEDQGCGIPEETLAQLGRPFTQAEDPYRRNYQGTGLGLSICFALARQMNGELRIESQAGKGTKGTLVLPGVASAQDDGAHANRAA